MGNSEGADVEPIVGNVDGAKVGVVVEGLLVGIMEGLLVGELERPVVGKLEGPVVGELEGLVVGIPE